MTVGEAGAGTVHAPSGMVASADHLASSAGVAALRAGGTAADAAVAAAAVLAVTLQHQCGLGGDLFALVHRPGEPVAALCAAGRAGSGADALGARLEGLDRLPPFDDVRAVTVPGCVDGWIELHRRFGRLPLAEVLEAAITYAATGFPATTLLAASSPLILESKGADDYLAPAMAAGGRLRPGALIRRPGVARALQAIAAEGRAGFYLGAFGDGLVRLGQGLFTREDLARSQAEWVEPLEVEVWGHTVHVPPPPSQGYLVAAGAAVAGALDLPDDPEDPRWAHLLAEASRVVAADREEVLHEAADGQRLLAPERLAARRALVDPDHRGTSPLPLDPGDTTVLGAVDADRCGVVLIQSNASAWGSRIVEPTTGIVLHNRGLGFHLAEGHPAELAPGRRPPHTLAPALVRRADGSLRALVGTMGGDVQPQVVLQLLARLLRHDQPPGRALRAGRWIHTRGGPRAPVGGFDLW
ncbi:MAG TPA: gamma-glutamyltransferase, partial [Acidimicrobiales bacterium]|nr:gamma-glutamyltransferase [Acidimicrobiales bacterium]